MKTFYVLLGLTLVFASSWAEEFENGEADEAATEDNFLTESESDWNGFGQCLSINKFRHLRIIGHLIDLECYRSHNGLSFNKNGFLRGSFFGPNYLKYIYNEARGDKIDGVLEGLYKFSVALLGEKLDDDLWRRLNLPERIFGGFGRTKGGFRGVLGRRFVGRKFGGFRGNRRRNPYKG